MDQPDKKRRDAEYEFIVKMFDISRNPPPDGAFQSLRALTRKYVAAQLRRKDGE